MTTAEHVRQLICLIERVLLDHELVEKQHVCEVIDLLELLVSSNSPWTLLQVASSNEKSPAQHLVANGLIRDINAWRMPLTILLPLLAELVAGEYWYQPTGGLLLGRVSEIPTRCLEGRVIQPVDEGSRYPFASRLDRYAASSNARLLTVWAIALRRSVESLDSILDGRQLAVKESKPREALVGVP